MTCVGCPARRCPVFTGVAPCLTFLLVCTHSSPSTPARQGQGVPLPTSKRGPRSCVSRASVTTLRQLILRTSPWVEHRSGVTGRDSRTIGVRSPVFPSSPAAWAASRPCEAQQSAPPSAPAGPELTIGPVITWMVAANPTLTPALVSPMASHWRLSRPGQPHRRPDASRSRVLAVSSLYWARAH